MGCQRAADIDVSVRSAGRARWHDPIRVQRIVRLDAFDQNLDAPIGIMRGFTRCEIERTPLAQTDDLNLTPAHARRDQRCPNIVRALHCETIVIATSALTIAMSNDDHALRVGALELSADRSQLTTNLATRFCFVEAEMQRRTIGC